MSFVLSPFVFVLSVLSGPVEQPRVLFYCDLSPGSVSYADTWHSVLTDQGRTVEYTTTPADFAGKLTGSPWEFVFVFSKHAEQEPEYAASLRNYILADNKRMAFLFIWHDNGESPAANREVMATTGMATWWAGGRSTIRYIQGTSADPEALKPKVYPGLLLPDFAGIGTTALLPLRSFEVVMTGAQRTGFTFQQQQPPGGGGDLDEAGCMSQFNNKVDTCFAELNQTFAWCGEVYDPVSGADPDIDKWVDCLNRAVTDFMNCINAARNRLKLCVQLVRARRPDATSQPAPDPGGG